MNKKTVYVVVEGDYEEAQPKKAFGNGEEAEKYVRIADKYGVSAHVVDLVVWDTALEALGLD
jgi:hypothetical protein